MLLRKENDHYSGKKPLNVAFKTSCIYAFIWRSTGEKLQVFSDEYKAYLCVKEWTNGLKTNPIFAHKYFTFTFTTNNKKQF